MAVPAILPLAIRPATWARDLDLVKEDFKALEASGQHGPGAEADRATIRAGIAALEGRTDDAGRLYREAIRAWRELGQPWREALTAVDMATLLDPADPAVRDAAAAGREILVRLRAAPFVDKLDAALARPSRETDPHRAEDEEADAPVRSV
jgi:hypothetical protein